MGITLHLAVDVDRMSETHWREIYDRARRVATQWIPRPLSTGWRHIGAVRVVQYCLEIETPEGLHIVGDAESLTTAESFVFPAKLPRGPRRDGAAASDDDILVAVARCFASDGMQLAPWCDLLGQKTQGLPYHTLIVALGLLVEHSLPGTAVVYGELGARETEQARCGLASILGEEVEPPVVADVERMRRRLAPCLSDHAIDLAVRVLGPPDPCRDAVLGDLLGLLRRTSDARVRHELEHVVLSCPGPDGLYTGTRDLLRSLVDAIRTGMVRWEIRARVERWGAARTREELAYRTRTGGLRLTSMAWDAIESADLDELAFLYTAACMDASRLEAHWVIRAVLENRALRRGQLGDGPSSTHTKAVPVCW